jgi:hypothetical protein
LRIGQENKAVKQHFLKRLDFMSINKLVKIYGDIFQKIAKGILSAEINQSLTMRWKSWNYELD